MVATWTCTHSTTDPQPRAASLPFERQQSSSELGEQIGEHRVVGGSATNVQVGESVALALVREEAGETLNDALCPERVVRGAHRTDDIIFQPDVNEALCT